MSDSLLRVGLEVKSGVPGVHVEDGGVGDDPQESHPLRPVGHQGLHLEQVATLAYVGVDDGALNDGEEEEDGCQ